METNRLQTLDRGIEALMAVAEAPGGITVAELAARLGIGRAIVYRLVGTLADRDMLRRLAGGRFVLGAGALVLAAHADGHLRAQARPHLERLAEETRASAFLSVAQGDDCVALIAVDRMDAVFDIRYRIGSRHPLNRGASGLAILSARPPRPDDPDNVRRARRDGYSLTRGELQPGAVGLACPLRLPVAQFPGLEASVGVVALERFDEARAVTAIHGCAATIAAAFDRLNPAR